HQVAAIVHASGGQHVVGAVGRHGLAVAPEDLEDAGQVELALLLGDGVEGGEELAAVERVRAHVDLANGEMPGVDRVWVLRLDYLLDIALRVTHDPPVAGRIEQSGSEQSGGSAGVLVGRDELPDRGGGDQRMV